MSGTKISSDDFMLLANGWHDSDKDVRIVLQSPEVTFGFFGKISKVSPESQAFGIELAGQFNAVSISIRGCACGFLDVPPEELHGRTVESGLVATRPGFSAFLMVLVD